VTEDEEGFSEQTNERTDRQADAMPPSLVQAQEIADHVRRVGLEQQIVHKPLQQEALQTQILLVQAAEPALTMNQALPGQYCVFEFSIGCIIDEVDLRSQLFEVGVATPHAEGHVAERHHHEVLRVQLA